MKPWNALSRLMWVVLMLVVLTSCGQHEMADNSRLKPYEEDPFFADGSSARPLVNGTVARGHLKGDSPFFSGMESGKYLAYCPIPVNRAVLERGRERFNIYCAVCHAQTGEGNGMVVQRGFTQPPSFHIARLRQMPVGYFFRIMTDGSRKMAPYRDVLDENDRWAVAAYIRALQQSRQVPIDQVTPDIQKELNKLSEDDPNAFVEPKKNPEPALPQ